MKFTSLFGSRSTKSQPSSPLPLSQQTSTTLQPTTTTSTPSKPTRENTHGLLPLSLPSPTNSQPSERQYPIDIIAIHGITGDAYSTWTNKDSSYFWLRDSLPREFPGARIYSFGYRADVIFSRDTGDFDGFARDLLEEIYDTRLSKEDKRRPLIFVCHSMGGIVVKKALNVCQIEPRYTHILSAVPSILFLSTPHGGSDPANMLATISKVLTIPIASIFVGRSRPELISALGRNSKELYTISKEFRHHTKNLKIFSFIEERFTPPLNKTLVVDEVSGSMNVDTENIVRMPGCNHQTICCFENEKSEGYRKVSNKLREVVEEATTKSENEIQAEDIPFPTMHDRLNSTSTAQPSTCTWLLSHPSFHAWSDRSSSTSDPINLLWIKGNPGTGKSTLMAFLHKHLTVTNSKDIQLSFFFYADGTLLQKSQLGMLRSLIHQMYKWSPSARKVIFSAYDNKVKAFGECGRSWDWEVDELRILFSEVLCLPPLRGEEIVLFVDALDEVDSEGDSLTTGELVSYFHELNDRIVAVGGATRICISCRHYPILTANQGLVINVEEFNMRDVARYVQYQLRIGVEGWEEESECARRALEDTITLKSKGVFLWVRFRIPDIVKRINDGVCSLENAPRLLDSETNELSPIYENILLRNIEVSLRPQALHFLQWVCLAERPLSISELRFAMACDDKNVEANQNRCEDSKAFVEEDSRMRKLTKSLSGGLVEVRRGSGMTVQVFHQTVTGFLRTRGLRILAESAYAATAPSSIDDVIGQAEQRLAISCLNYLSFPEVLERATSQVEGIEETLGFIRYAAGYWFLHAERAERRGIVHNILQRFKAIPKLFEIWKLIHFQTDRWNATRGMDMIHVASRANLITVVKQLLDEGISIEEEDDYGFTPLHHASQNGNLDLTTMLLDRNANIEAKTGGQSTPLGCAAANGQSAIVRLLLKKGAEVNEDTGYTGSALQAAVTKGNMPLVRCLVDNGANINDVGGFSGSALQAAVHAGHLAIVSFLINKDADMDASSGDLGSILQAAVMGRPEQAETMIRLLVDEGADVNVQGGRYGNALQAAAQKKLLPFVELFLKEGADVNAQGGMYGNALQAAASNEIGGEEGEEIVPLLLKSGANVNACGGEYGTALQAAASCGDMHTVQLLLKSGADINTECGRYGCALQAAAASPGPEVVQLLLDNGARLDLKGGVYGNALQAAAYAGNFEVARLLLERGIDINEHCGEYGSALQAAVISGKEKLVRFLLDEGADVNAQGGEYQNALRAAVFWNKEPLVNMLLDRGADPNIVARIDPVTYGPFGSPLHIAAARGRLSIVRTLLDNGADPNLQCDWSGNALGAAVSDRHRLVVDLLLERGADPTVLDQMYGSPFLVAEGNAAMAKVLEKSKRVKSRDRSAPNAVDG
ncbi:ankyrin repeat-containing domain protein [Rhexocercosporidium sp. MPI-PUGE-AT-0058]|nr:ankyrin repeat-containing domain protein [Rhexocercosporidium sp. MPI-PUGE-AT-0058]